MCQLQLFTVLVVQGVLYQENTSCNPPWVGGGSFDSPRSIKLDTSPFHLLVWILMRYVTELLCIFRHSCCSPLGYIVVSEVVVGDIVYDEL